MDVKYIDEIIKTNDYKIKRIARLYSSSTTTAVNIFKEIVSDKKVDRVILYTHNEELKAFIYSDDYNGSLLTIFDSCDLNVALGHRVSEVVCVLTMLLAAKHITLEFCSEKLNTPYRENN